MSARSQAPQVIDSKVVKTLAQTHALGGATILGRPGGWAVLVRYGSVERAVAAQKSRQMRLWRRVGTAVDYVREELGMDRFDVDATAHDPSANRIKRPDQAERMRKQHEAAEHDIWFRVQVQEALDGVAAGTNPAVAEGDVRKRLDTLRRLTQPL